jgi:hypothetical protein
MVSMLAASLNNKSKKERTRFEESHYWKCVSGAFIVECGAKSADISLHDKFPGVINQK